MFNLDAQIQHKINFIQTYVPEDVKIHLIGHSVGAWMVLELMKIEEIKAKIQHSYLLFPTIEGMAKSPNGFLFTKIIQPLWFILRIVIILFNKCPKIFQAFILFIYFFIMSIPKHFMGTALKYSNINIMEQVLFLADEEMKRIVTADVSTIHENRSIIKFYYGASDGWSPIKYYQQLRNNIPDVDAEIDIYQMDHAFVLRSSVQMGKLVGSWIAQKQRF